ncbi:MAG: flagellar biosynthesis/type III secretory pathway M-ring protein FliF/YscJ [Candidatus Paceibacteria bacterium]|jgi:flagellar biosynthesis/type III secretory pathway M-ring protein FliF/YscJ
MKDRFLQLIALFQSARPATRITLVIGTLAVSAIALFSSWFANRPDLVQLWAGISTAEAAEYKNALAQAAIPFRSSPPPENGIWVDSADRTIAEAHVAMAGFRPVQKGIQVTDGGAASAFLSAGARKQMENKREWQECELQLENLGFIDRATVVTSGSDGTPFGPSKEPTISVTLGLRGGVMLDSSEARTVAALVRSRFNVPLENITVVDERGNLIHDGADSGGMSNNDLFNHKRRYDNDAERRATKALEMALGRGMALVTVNSVWVYDEKESVTERALPSAAPYFESKSDTKSTQSSNSAGGPAGMSANITQDFGNETAAVGGGGGSGGENTTKESEIRSIVGRETEHTSSRTPRITRISLSLTMDESKADQLTQIEGIVKAAVGFDTTRNDYFESFTTVLASVERDEDGKVILPAALEPVEEPNAYMELALEHGVEILAALGFLVVLMKSLKSASALKGGQAVASNGATAGAAPLSSGSEDRRRQDLSLEEVEQMNMELLARAQVEELVRSNPEKVSEILAQWAKSTAGPVGVGK